MSSTKNARYYSGTHMRCPSCGFENTSEIITATGAGCIPAATRREEFECNGSEGSGNPGNREEGSVNLNNSVELTVVIPCLNEADTLADCVEKAIQAIRQNGTTGEVIVADNGSSDGSPEIAREKGARVVPVSAQGYGSALMGGIAAARGTFIIMGDADGSYDFAEIPRLLGKLREGYDLVQGCRLPAGGGTIKRGAMPALHRWIGNPAFSLIARSWFGVPIHDIYCGLRGFTKEHYKRLGQKCTGMEFATEMIIKSSSMRAKMTEVAITLHPDGRKSHPPHLRTFRDGWRTLRFFLLCSPRWLFVIPGIALLVLGVLGYAIALPGLRVSGITFDAHTLLFATVAILCGFQSVFFGIFAHALAIWEGILPEEPRLASLLRNLKLERCITVGGVALIFGVVLLLTALDQWRRVDYGPLNYGHTMRFVVPGAMLTALGFQTMISSFFLTLLELRRP